MVGEEVTEGSQLSGVDLENWTSETLKKKDYKKLPQRL